MSLVRIGLLSSFNLCRLVFKTLHGFSVSNSNSFTTWNALRRTQVFFINSKPKLFQVKCLNVIVGFRSCPTMRSQCDCTMIKLIRSLWWQLTICLLTTKLWNGHFRFWFLCNFYPEFCWEQLTSFVVFHRYCGNIVYIFVWSLINVELFVGIWSF